MCICRAGGSVAGRRYFSSTYRYISRSLSILNSHDCVLCGLGALIPKATAFTTGCSNKSGSGRFFCSAEHTRKCHSGDNCAALDKKFSPCHGFSAFFERVMMPAIAFRKPICSTGVFIYDSNAAPGASSTPPGDARRPISPDAPGRTPAPPPRRTRNHRGGLTPG